MKNMKQIKTQIKKGTYTYMFDWLGFAEPADLNNETAIALAEKLQNISTIENLTLYKQNEIYVYEKQINKHTVYEILPLLIDNSGLSITLIPIELAEQLVELNVIHSSDKIEKSIVLHDDANLCFVDTADDAGLITLPNKTVICDTDIDDAGMYFAGMFFDVPLTDESELASFFNMPHTHFETVA